MALSSVADSQDMPDCGAPARLGIFGGTFDPIHLGHLIIAQEVRALLGLNKIFFVPARVSPLKALASTLFSAEDRARMVRLAIADNPCFQLSCVDVKREGPSFTLDTLRLFHQRLGPDAQISFIMGMDSLAHFHLWREPQEIMRMARLAVVTRPGAQLDWDALEDHLPGIRDATDLIDTLQIGISSTDIRRRLRQGLPIRYQVPPAVHAFIRDHQEELGLTGR